MNKLWESMGKYMNINPYNGETEEEYISRLCFSGLGLWCLKMAQKSEMNLYGRSKNGMTINLDKLLEHYKLIMPSIAEYFTDTSTAQRKISTLIRRVYEETGYLLTTDENEDYLADHGRTIEIGYLNLFFGLPDYDDYVGSMGLGVYTGDAVFPSTIEEVFIRDNLSAEDYYNLNFDLCDFNGDRGINVNELEFFDPSIRKAPSDCWVRGCIVGSKRVNGKLVDATLARKFQQGPYYKVIRDTKGNFFFHYEEPDGGDSLTSREYRRLYFAIRNNYKNPVRMDVIKLDNEYSEIRFHGTLPNREYYFLLLVAWPKGNAFKEFQFIIQTDMLEKLYGVFERLGLETKR